MKILLITKMFPRPGNDNFGSYVYDQISALKKLGVDIKVFAPHTYVPKWMGFLGGKIKIYADAHINYKYREIDVFSPPCIWSRKFIKNPEIKYMFFRKSIKDEVMRVCEEYRPDIIYSLDATMEGRLSIEIGSIFEIPVVIIEHSMPKFYLDLYGQGKYETIYKNVVKYANEIIFVSNAQKQAFQDVIGEQIKGTVITNGFVREEIQPRKADVFNQKQIKIVCIGYLEERKGYPVLLKALKRYVDEFDRNILLSIIGDGIERIKYEKIVEEYHLSDVCRFLGIISHKDVFEMLNANDIFVLPSYGEALGIAYLEAMNCGLPIIGTKFEGISDIVEHKVNGILIDKGNDEELCNAIKWLVENKIEAKRIATAGRETVRNLTWENNAILLKQRFEDVAREGCDSIYDL